MTASPPPRLLAAAALLDVPAVDMTATRAPAGVAALLARRLATDPARPLVTFYDDATGERVEFSATTLDNWVAKTANMLVDTLGLGLGDRIGIALPTHWLGLVIALAGWSAGLELILIPDDAEPDDAEPEDGAPGAGASRGVATGVPAVAQLPATTSLGALFVAADRLDTTVDLLVDETVVLSLRPLGGRLSRPIPGVLDYAAEVPPHGDRFTAPPPPPDQAGLVRAALATASRWNLGPADRLLCTAAPDTADGLLGGLLAPLAAGSSIVLCRRLDPAVLDRRIATERITALVAPSAFEAEPDPTAAPAGAAAPVSAGGTPSAPRILRLTRVG